MSNGKPLPPLITRRSPSYERAWRAVLRQSGRDDRRKQEALNILSELSNAERDASAICARVSTLLTDDDFAAVVHDRAELHSARRQGIGKLMEQLGSCPQASDRSPAILVQTLESAASANTNHSAEESLALLNKELRALYEAALQNENLGQLQRAALATYMPAHTNSR